MDPAEILDPGFKQKEMLTLLRISALLLSVFCTSSASDVFYPAQGTCIYDVPVEVLNRFEFDTADVFTPLVGLPGVRKSFANPIRFFDLLFRGDEGFKLIKAFLAGAYDHLTDDEHKLVRTFIDEMAELGVIPEHVSKTFWIYEKLAPHVQGNEIEKPVIKPNPAQLHFLYHLLFKVGVSFEDDAPNFYTNRFHAVLKCFLADEYRKMEMLARGFLKGYVSLPMLLDNEKAHFVFQRWVFERLVKWNCDLTDKYSAIHILRMPVCAVSLCKSPVLGCELIKFGLEVVEPKLPSLAVDASVKESIKFSIQFMLSNLKLDREQVLRVMQGDYTVPLMSEHGSMIFFFVPEKAQYYALIPRQVYDELDVNQTADYLMKQTWPNSHDEPTEKEIKAAFEIARRVATGEAIKQPFGPFQPDMTVVSYQSCQAIREWLGELKGEDLVPLFELSEGFTDAQLQTLGSFVGLEVDNLIGALGNCTRLPNWIVFLIKTRDVRIREALDEFCQGNQCSSDNFFDPLKRAVEERAKQDDSYQDALDVLETSRRVIGERYCWYSDKLPRIFNHQLSGSTHLVSIEFRNGADNVTLKVPKEARIVDLYVILTALSDIFPKLRSGFIHDDSLDLKLCPLADPVDMHTHITIVNLLFHGEKATWSAQLSALCNH